MRIFYDVDTQNDFMNKAGALYVPGAEEIKPNLKVLTDFAREKGIPVLGSVDRHFGTVEYKEREGELQRWGGPFPDHCMDGTEGQWKIGETTLVSLSGKAADFSSSDGYSAAEYIPNIPGHDLENPLEFVDAEIINYWKGRGHYESAIQTLKTGIDTTLIGKIVRDIQETKHLFNRGIYFEKQSYDVFTNPNLAEFLRRAGIKEAIVYGVATDYCVKAAVLGMQNMGIQTYVVEDAIKGITEESSQSALEEMAKAGVRFIRTQQVLEGKI